MKESLHYLLMSDHFLFQKKMGVWYKKREAFASRHVFFYKTACKISDIITMTANNTPLIRIVLLTSFFSLIRLSHPVVYLSLIHIFSLPTLSRLLYLSSQGAVLPQTATHPRSRKFHVSASQTVLPVVSSFSCGYDIQDTTVRLHHVTLNYVREPYMTELHSIDIHTWRVILWCYPHTHQQSRCV